MLPPASKKQLNPNAHEAKYWKSYTAPLPFTFFTFFPPSFICVSFPVFFYCWALILLSFILVAKDLAKPLRSVKLLYSCRKIFSLHGFPGQLNFFWPFSQACLTELCSLRHVWKISSCTSYSQCQIKLSVTVKTDDNHKWYKRAKKVVSDSLGPVEFAIRLVNSVFNLPVGQVIYFEEFE